MISLNGKRVAIITENGFEEVELTSPKKALEEAGATVKTLMASFSNAQFSISDAR